MRLKEFIRSKPGFHTALGVFFAILACLLALGYLGDRSAGPPVLVPVAARDIQAGEVVVPDMTSTGETNECHMVPGTLEDSQDVIGERALRFFGKGEPFTESAITGRGVASLSSRIPPEYRAYSLLLSSGAGAGPELQPGDLVDVLSTTTDPPRTVTLLRGRSVLCTSGGSNSSAEGGVDDPNATNVTLLVTPSEAEMLA